jgi:hypothetical protein
MGYDLIHISDVQYRELRKAYDKAVDEKKEQFVLFEQDVVTGFAKYWLQAVEEDRKKRGLRLYLRNKNIKIRNGYIWKLVSKNKEMKL